MSTEEDREAPPRPDIRGNSDRLPRSRSRSPPRRRSRSVRSRSRSPRSYSRSRSPPYRGGRGGRDHGRFSRSPSPRYDRRRSGSRDRDRDRGGRYGRDRDFYYRDPRDSGWEGFRERGPPPDDFYDGRRGGGGPDFGRPGPGGRGGPYGLRGDGGPPPFHGDQGDRGGGSDRRRGEGLPGVSLLVRNVGPQITMNDLQHAFARIGPVRDVYIPRDYHSQQPKGFAFVEYANINLAREARDEMDRFRIKGCELEVVFAQERRKTPNEMRGRVVNPNNHDDEGGSRGDSRDFERSSSFERHRQHRRNQDSFEANTGNQ